MKSRKTLQMASSGSAPPAIASAVSAPTAPLNCSGVTLDDLGRSANLDSITASPSSDYMPDTVSILKSSKRQQSLKTWKAKILKLTESPLKSAEVCKGGELSKVYIPLAHKDVVSTPFSHMSSSMSAPLSCASDSTLNYSKNTKNLCIDALLRWRQKKKAASNCLLPKNGPPFPLPSVSSILVNHTLGPNMITNSPNNVVGVSSPPSANDSEQHVETSSRTWGRSLDGRFLLSEIASSSDILPEQQPCLFCGAINFFHETPGFCCSGGAVILASNSLRVAIRELLGGKDENSVHFRSSIRTYNNHLAFTSLGVRCDTDLARCNRGVYTFRVEGQVYHFLPDLESDTEKPTHLQFYFHDSASEVAARIKSCPRLSETILNLLIPVLQNNPYARFFRSLRLFPNLEDKQIVLFCNPSVDQRVFNKPTQPQVAAILELDDECGLDKKRSIRVYNHTGGSHNIQYYYAFYDPLQYPLMFPFGDLGWHQYIPKQATTNSVTFQPPFNSAGGVLIPENTSTADTLLSNEAEVLSHPNRNPNSVSIREYYCYKFQIRPTDTSHLLSFGRLFQQFAVDMYVKMETQRLDWFSSQQDNIRRDFLQGLANAIASGEKDCSQVGHRVIMPSSFIGGPRHMKQKYLDAMSLVQKYGKPDFFITVTCNPSWHEIREVLPKGQLAQDRPDLTVRVFHSKLEEFKKYILKKHIFGKVVGYTYVIEFQKRGLPHAHFLLILDKRFKLFNPTEFDKFVSAELPNEQQQPHLYKLVVHHMMHGPCGKENPTNVCMLKKGQCKNAYPKVFAEETTSSNDAYPLYKRRNNGQRVQVRGCWLDNRWVVPYNGFLLAKFDCHMNVEICSTIKAVKYIYKYICKGHDRVMYRVSDQDHEGPIDEIKQYVSARWISPPEALWRTYRLNMGELKPPVIHLQIHLENFQPIMFNKKKMLQEIVQNPSNQKTMLTEFFYMNRTDRQAQLCNCTYAEFPTHFVWLSGEKKWRYRQRGTSIGRMILAQPSESERYFLRLLLSVVRCPKSFIDLRTYNNTSYLTYREAALARGLLKNDNSQELCMREASSFGMPYELRRLFSTLLIYTCPNEPVKLWLQFKESLCEDFKKQPGLSDTEISALALRQINGFLQSMGKNLSLYGIDIPYFGLHDTTDLTRELRAERDIVVSSSDLLSHTKLNSRQMSAYTTITTHIASSKPAAFFVDGPGGTGKTFLYRALLAYVRSKGFVALATATSGIAASLLPGGRTAHSRFKIPIDTSGSYSCKVSKQSSLGVLIKEAKLILWDEAPMCRKHAVESLDELLKDIMDSEVLFGGKVVILGGDFRQTLPIVKRGTKRETINTSLISSYIWKHLNRLELVENMRARCDPDFTRFLLELGEGKDNVSDSSQVSLPASILIHPESGQSGIDCLIESVFPNISGVECPTEFANRAILTTKNQFADEINDILVTKIQGEPTEYLSYDETFDPQMQGQYEDFINSLTPNGMPPHKLILKVNSSIILLRNLDPTEGLCNGTRLFCKELSSHVIQAEISTGDFIGKKVFIHRISLQPPDDELYPVPYKRTQFPVRLCFAMSINKSRGQTLDFVGVYLKEPVFSHGQLYVALSRATTSKAVRVYINPTYFDNTVPGTTTNVVYKEVLNC